MFSKSKSSFSSERADTSTTETVEPDIVVSKLFLFDKIVVRVDLGWIVDGSAADVHKHSESSPSIMIFILSLDKAMEVREISER